MERHGSIRVWPAVVGLGVLLVALVAALAVAITQELSDSHDREIRDVAIQRAALANELAAGLPELTLAKMRNGFTAEEIDSVTAAVARLEETQPVVGIAIFNRNRELVYPPAPRGIDFRLPAGMNRALAGEPAVERLREGSAGDSAAIEASVPIRAPDGNVIGVLAMALDEDELRSSQGDDRKRVFITLIAAAVLLWLVLLPLLLRLAPVVAPLVSPQRWRMRRGIRRALTAGELELHYQPKIELGSGLCSAAEALVRWRREDRLVSPGEFLPYVEDGPLLRDLTAFVLDRAAADAAQWRGAGHDLGVAVNLSPLSLLDEELPARVEATLERHGIEPSLLTVEVTERAVPEDPSRVELVMTRLEDMGVSISVDDFGTGHGSLARLHALPIREVKIDRSFVNRMTADERPFVEAIATMARALGLKVVAEGVEDLATRELVAASGCDSAQGFFFCRPLPPAAFLAWLDSPHANDMAALEEAGIVLDGASVEHLVEGARRVTGADVAWLARVQEERFSFETVRGDDSLWRAQEGKTVELPELYCSRMIHGEIPNAITDTRENPNTRDLAASGDITSYVGVPVRLPDGRLYGSLSAAGRIRRRHEPETVRILALLARRIGDLVASGA
jgi:EAL domain-containing protein (putative c-di-GMP-specific phosphodiesterase class I)